MTWINIPKDWTGNQALAIVEFLDELSAAIWKVHELKMLDAWHEREATPITENENGAVEHRRIPRRRANVSDDFPF